MNKTTKTKWLAGGAVAAFIVLMIALVYPALESRRYLGKAARVLQSTSGSANRAYQGAGVDGFAYLLKGPLPEAELL